MSTGLGALSRVSRTGLLGGRPLPLPSRRALFSNSSLLLRLAHSRVALTGVCISGLHGNCAGRLPPPCSLQENQIHQRIADLRKEGLWSLRRLPKLQEAPRPRSHWDCLLEEMQWMAADFAQERRWKVAAAQKVGLRHRPPRCPGVITQRLGLQVCGRRSPSSTF